LLVSIIMGQDEHFLLLSYLSLCDAIDIDTVSKNSGRGFRVCGQAVAPLQQ